MADSDSHSDSSGNAADDDEVDELVRYQLEDGDDDDSDDDDSDDDDDEEYESSSDEISSCHLPPLSDSDGSITDKGAQGIVYHWEKQRYRCYIRPIKRNQHNFNLCPHNGRGTRYFTEKVCKQLGQYLYNNDKVIKIDLSDIMNLTDGCVRELFLPWNIDFNDGRIILNHQRIRDLRLCDNVRIGSNGIRGLVPFLRNNSNLQVLKLSNVNMGLDGAIALSSVFEDTSNCTSCILHHLDISGNGLGDLAVETLSRALRNITTLKKLNLSSNDIERYLCISPLLEHLDHQSPSPTSSSSSHFSLRKLYLWDNDLTDNSITQLSQSLHRDKSLIKVDLSENPRITEDGWNSLFRAIFNTTSISSLFDSNHTIRSFGDIPRQYRHIHWIMKQALRAQCDSECTSSFTIGRQKIVGHYFSSTIPLSQEVFGIDIKFMPNILALLGNDEIKKMYNIVRNWNMPSLFLYPSRERVRMNSCIRKLELEKNAILSEHNNLLKKNRELNTLRDENTNLKREINDLKNERIDLKRENKRLRTKVDQLESR